MPAPAGIFAERPSREVRAFLLGAYLSAREDTMHGSFNHTKPLLQLASRWASTLWHRRPRIDVVQLHIVHDSAIPEPAVLQANHSRRAWKRWHRSGPILWMGPPERPLVVLHRTTHLRVNMSNNDARFLAYEEVLAALRLPTDACLAAVDVSDVGLIGNLSHLCAQWPTSVIAATDFHHCGHSYASRCASRISIRGPLPFALRLLPCERGHCSTIL